MYTIQFKWVARYLEQSPTSSPFKLSASKSVTAPRAE